MYRVETMLEKKMNSAIMKGKPEVLYAPQCEENNQAGGDYKNDGDDGDDGVWIGVDWGTTNCAAAVYDRSRGGAKWMRLVGNVLATTTSHGKVGRILPTVLILATAEFVQQEQPPEHKKSTCCWQDVSDLFPSVASKLYACVGAVAEDLLTANNASTSDSSNSTSKCNGNIDPAALTAATIRSVKRPILQQLASFSAGKEEVPNEVQIAVTPLASRTVLNLDVVSIVAVFLRTIRTAADAYLQTAIFKKGLRVPGYNNNSDSSSSVACRHCCLGVPATATIAYRTFMLRAARKAGFRSAVTVTESTAAAMAYGLFVRSTTQEQPQTLLVLDMGGGTTDVTIAERGGGGSGNDDDATPHDDVSFSESSFSADYVVRVTVGNDLLGGDDMDQALLEAVIKKVREQQAFDITDLAELESSSSSSFQKQRLLRQCQQAKLLLCGDGNDVKPAEHVVVTVQGIAVSITQQDWELALQPILKSIRQVLQLALRQYQQKEQDPTATKMVDEVILIGGASRVPAVRKFLCEIFLTDYELKNELCLSINAMSAVAQGCAVSAALQSHTVPLHELRSALMLDTSPHAIGVLLPNGGDDQNLGRFVEILPRNATLPASGHATFSLSDLHQAGVTVHAVEQIGSAHSEAEIVAGSDGASSWYSTLGVFTFLLHRLSNQQISRLTVRHVDIGMTLRQNGEFVVSIFDANDPDHIRKKERYLQAKRKSGSETTKNQLDYTSTGIATITKAVVDDQLSVEQVSLILACIILFFLYVAAKIAFHDQDALIAEGE